LARCAYTDDLRYISLQTASLEVLQDSNTLQTVSLYPASRAQQACLSSSSRTPSHNYRDFANHDTVNATLPG